MTEPLTKPLAATVQMTAGSLALLRTGRFGWGPAAGWVMAPWLAR